MASCSAGFYSWGGSTSCSPCPHGWLCNDGLALPCATTDNLIAGSGTTCEPCPAGNSCLGGVTEQCPTGKYSGGGALAMGKQCINCKPGTYADVAGSATCKLCSAGTTSNFGQDHCVLCNIDEYNSVAGGFPCISCPSGKVNTFDHTACQ